MLQTLVLDNYHPLSVNKLLSTHPHRRSKIKRAEYDVIAGEALRQRITKAATKRRVTIRCEGWPRGTVPDSDNLRKCFFDALVAAGLLIDDSPAWCEQGPLDVVRAKGWRTVIVLEDVE